MKRIDIRVKMLDYIRDFINEKEYPPAIEDIRRDLCVSSKSVVVKYLELLEQQGLIKRDKKTSRSIKITDMGRNDRMVPLLGTIAAGEPIPVPGEDSWQNRALEMVEVPGEYLKAGSRVYALNVKGKSMIDALIDDGDVVILEATSTADDGEMVAVWLTDRQRTTLKKIYREADRVRLQPANRNMKPIYVDARNLQVQGRVVAVMRKYHTEPP
ncbi:transcriptional repressor LexA [Chloroflexota bacterium]